MRTDISITNEWVAECWRCSNSSTTPAEGHTDAVSEFVQMGWRKTRDGYQLCPQCASPVR